MTMLAPFLDQTVRTPDRTAIVADNGAGTSYGALASWSAGLARRYRAAGIEGGDRVLVAVPVSPALYAALIALWRLGAVAVFPEPSAGLAGLRHAAAVARPKAMVGPFRLRLLRSIFRDLRTIRIALSPDEGGDGAAPDILADVAPGQPALVSFTSGSTGAPKGIVRTHAFLLAQHGCLAPLLAPEPCGDTDLVWFPAFVLSGLALGVTNVLPSANLAKPADADPAALAAQIERESVTRMLAPPAVFAGLVERSCQLNLRGIFTGGGPVFPKLLQGLVRLAPRSEVHVVYGSTEAEPIAHVKASEISGSDWHAMSAGKGLLAGTPVAEIRMSILNDEIVVSGDHVNKGYLNPADDAKTKLTRDGAVWHRTGDAGRLDDRGRLWLLGRMEGRVGGHFPFAVETAALSWTGVRQAALVGIDRVPILAIAGNPAQAEEWTRQAAKTWDLQVRTVDSIPLDKRHNSKIDYVRLSRLLRQ